MRFEDIAARTGTPLENFALVEGDITRENLGMADEDLETIRAETTDLYHLAAAYDLAVPKSVAFAVNLEGTQNVNEFARSLPNLKRYNYISTCYVAGKRDGHAYWKRARARRGFSQLLRGNEIPGRDGGRAVKGRAAGNDISARRSWSAIRGRARYRSTTGSIT